MTRDEAVVLIDDTRSFRDERPHLLARTSAEGVELLQRLQERRIEVLWLDHDLGGTDTIAPVLSLLESHPFDIGKVRVHSANATGTHRIRTRLTRAGYDVVVDYDHRQFHQWLRPTLETR